MTHGFNLQNTARGASRTNNENASLSKKAANNLYGRLLKLARESVKYEVNYVLFSATIFVCCTFESPTLEALHWLPISKYGYTFLSI